MNDEETDENHVGKMELILSCSECYFLGNEGQKLQTVHVVDRA